MNILDKATLDRLCDKIRFLALQHANAIDAKDAEEYKARQDKIVANVRALGVLKIDVSKCN
jgi:hypothetical protein